MSIAACPNDIATKIDENTSAGAAYVDWKGVDSELGGDLRPILAPGDIRHTPRLSVQVAVFGVLRNSATCDLNRAMQHLHSHYREVGSPVELLVVLIRC